MLGYAVLSFPDNGIGGFVAQGLGTSMLQVPNLMKKPVLWIPPTITAAVTGALSTCVFRMRNNGLQYLPVWEPPDLWDLLES